MDAFLWRALLGGIGVAMVAGPVGCFVVWRRMAYFGDTLAHSALLGIALSILLEINPNVGMVAICLLLALLLVLLQHSQQLATDTLLGILSHSTLSLGLIAVAFLETVRIDLYAYLFGDLLAISYYDLYWIYGGGAIILLGLAAIWRSLLLMTVQPDMAQAEGIPVKRIHLSFMLLLALVIAIAMKIVGILLITALLIIPAAAARSFAKTPEQMAILASIIGAAAVVFGLWSSLHWDTPAGPSVVVAATLLFALTLAIPKRT